MSLTSFLKDKKVKELFASEFKKPRDKIVGEIKAPPITKHYAMMGIAFDYLMRFYLEYHNPKAKTEPWVAEISVLKISKMEMIEQNLPFYDIFDKAIENLEFARVAYSKFKKNGILNEDILKSVILLAQLDPIYRAGYINPNMGVVDNGDIQDLRNLISLVNIEDFKANSYCLLNPTFGEGSKLVGGADADIVIDNQMIDIKTTKKAEVSSEMFNQIIGYYILGTIGGIGREKFDISNISEIGFYFSRYGIKYMYEVGEIIEFNSLPSVTNTF